MAALPQGTQEFEALRRWTRVHRPVLQYLSAQELGVYDDPSKGAHTLYMVLVQPRPQETNERKKFEITQAVPFPIADTGRIAPKIREAYEATNASNSRLGLGTYMVAIMREGSTMPPNIVPMGFELGSALPDYRVPGGVIDDINSGKVF